MLFPGCVRVCVSERVERERDTEHDAQMDIQSLCQQYQEFKEETGRYPPVLRRFPFVSWWQFLFAVEPGELLVLPSFPCFHFLASLEHSSSLRALPEAVQVCSRSAVSEQCLSVWAPASALPYQGRGISGHRGQGRLGLHIPLCPSPR